MLCHFCKTDLHGLECVEKHRNDICLSCYNKQFGKKCVGCHEYILPGTKYAKHDDKLWHKECFNCTNCKSVLGSYKIDKDRNFYCSACFDKKYAKICSACQKVINGLHVICEGRLFHKDCFRCCSKNCRKQLDCGYISKGDEIYCEECYKDVTSKEIFTETFYSDYMLHDLVKREQQTLKSLAETHRTGIELEISSATKRLTIPRIKDDKSSQSQAEHVQHILNILPNIVIGARVQNGLIQICSGDLISQNMDIIVITIESKILLNYVLQRAGPKVRNEFNQFASEHEKNWLIETGPGKLNCKSILFVSWELPETLESKALKTSLENFISESLDYILNHPKRYKTVAFPAVGCSLSKYPIHAIANSTVKATYHKLWESKFSGTISFVISPQELAVHQRFADCLLRVKSHSEPFGFVDCVFSQFQIKLTAKQKRNLETCRSELDAYLKLCSFNLTRPNNEDLQIWTQHILLNFYSRCLNKDVWPKIDFKEGTLKLVGKKESTEYCEKFFLESNSQALKQLKFNEMGRNIIWEYETGPSVWEGYSYRCNSEIEYAFTVTKKSEFKFVNDNEENCRIDFNKLQEKTNDHIRKIRRRELNEYQYPEYWEKQTENCCRLYVHESTEEYQQVQNRFDTTMKGKYTHIISIERIQNQRWYKQYAAHREAMNNRLKQNAEKILFHGCKEESASLIIEECFNRSYAGVNGTVYGCGVYFADNALYSNGDRYAVPNGKMEKHMFVVSVLVGKSTLGKFSTKVCPHGYDSTTDGKEIYVVYHDAQAYADYLIKYK